MNRKDYRVTVKVRNNNILKAAEAAGHTSVPRLAELVGCQYSRLNGLINMTTSPLTSRWTVRPWVERLCVVLEVSFDDLFSEQQCEALVSNRRDVEVDAEQMFAIVNAPKQELLGCDDGLGELVQEAIKRLLPREQKVLGMHFGFEGPVMTLAAIGEVLGISVERVRQIECKALRKLRHPQRSDPLRQFMPTTGVYDPSSRQTIADEIGPPNDVREWMGDWTARFHRAPSMNDFLNRWHCSRALVETWMFALRAPSEAAA